MNSELTGPGAESPIPPITIVIEWENAIDVEDKWTRRAMQAFEAELRRCGNRLERKPAVLYLYDDTAVDEGTIRAAIESSAPDLPSLADVRFVPAPGLTYYQLKNRGAALAETDLVVMLDSDAGPQPGWLPALLAPFADPRIQAVGGFTMLGYEDLLSRTLALSWIFDLESELEKTAKRRKIHANNCAFRTGFLRDNPYPALPAFKKACGFWLRDIEARNIQWARAADARTLHAPHPGGSFIVWRAWTTGTDRDYQVSQTVTGNRLGRMGYSFYFAARKLGRSWWRIWTKGGEVGLPVWQRPAAMAITFGFYTVAWAGELFSAATRSFGSPERTAGRPLGAAGA